MNIPALSFQIDKTASLVTATVRGELAFDDLRSMLHTFLLDPDLDPSVDRLWDLREAQLPLSGADIGEMARVVHDVGESPGGRRLAIVATSDLPYGLVRMYTVFVEETNIETHAFHDIDQAPAWLKRKNGARRTASPTGMSSRLARKTPSTKSNQLVRHNPTRWT